MTKPMPVTASASLPETCGAVTEWMRGWGEWDRRIKEREGKKTKNLWEREKVKVSMRRRKEEHKVMMEIQVVWKRRRGRRSVRRRRKACSHCASVPTSHTHYIHTHTVDINNHLLIFICSGEMWGQSNPVRNCLSTCLSLCVVPYIKCSWSLNESFCGHFHPVCRHWNNMSSFSFCITRDTLSHGDCGIGRSKAIYNTYFYRTGWEMQGLILFSFCHIPSLPLLHTSHSFSFTVLTAVDRHICPLHH